MFGASEDFMSALDLAVRRIVALMDRVEAGVRVVVARRIAQLDRAGRWVELDADLLLRRERRREIGRLNLGKREEKMKKIQYQPVPVKLDKHETRTNTLEIDSYLVIEKQQKQNKK